MIMKANVSKISTFAHFIDTRDYTKDESAEPECKLRRSARESSAHDRALAKQAS